MLLMGNLATHSKAWLIVLASQVRMVDNPLKAHDHHEKSMHNRATLSTSHAIGTTMKLLRRNQVLKRPK